MPTTHCPTVEAMAYISVNQWRRKGWDGKLRAAMFPGATFCGVKRVFMRGGEKFQDKQLPIVLGKGRTITNIQRREWHKLAPTTSFECRLLLLRGNIVLLFRPSGATHATPLQSVMKFFSAIIMIHFAFVVGGFGVRNIVRSHATRG